MVLLLGNKKLWRGGCETFSTATPLPPVCLSLVEPRWDRGIWSFFHTGSPIVYLVWSIPLHYGRLRLSGWEAGPTSKKLKRIVWESFDIYRSRNPYLKAMFAPMLRFYPCDTCLQDVLSVSWSTGQSFGRSVGGSIVWSFTCSTGRLIG